MEFPSIQATSLVDQVEERIRSVILESDMKAGDRLPGEIDLASQMGVSRNVVREALGRLQTLGILESRKRRGIVISEPDILAGMAKMVGLPIFDEASQRELVEFRLIIELGLSDVIMLHRSPEGMRKLEQIVRREEKDPADPLVATQCDLEFHSTLFEMVENSTLRRFQTLLVKFFEWSIAHMEVRVRRFEDADIVSHRDLLELLRKGDGEGFHAAMRKHLATHREVLEQQFAKERAAKGVQE